MLDNLLMLRLRLGRTDDDWTVEEPSRPFEQWLDDYMNTTAAVDAVGDLVQVPAERVSTRSSIASDHRWTSSSFAANAGLT
jgi:hypothetical protein